MNNRRKPVDYLWKALCYSYRVLMNRSWHFWQTWHFPIWACDIFKMFLATSCEPMQIFGQTLENVSWSVGCAEVVSVVCFGCLQPVLGAWCLVLDAGAWCLMLGAWCLVLDAWCLVLDAGAWCLMLQAWCLTAHVSCRGGAGPTQGRPRPRPLVHGKSDKG